MLISVEQPASPPATAAPADAGGSSISSPTKMAIAVGHCHELRPPGVVAVRGRHCRLRSVTQLDDDGIGAHDVDHRDRSSGHNAAGLSPRRSLSSPCFTTTTTTVPPPPPAAAASDDEDNKKTLLLLPPRVEIVAGGHARGVHELIAEAACAIATGTRLVPAQSGVGGALLLEDGRSGEHVAVIKPLDDDGGVSGNGYASKAVLREVAAFLLDHDGFARVEPTALIRITRGAATTTASIQRFAAHEYDAGELGPSRFSVSSVHRVGILDVRLLNIDRHAGNILVKKTDPTPTSATSSSTPPLDLVPIDHGLCLPEQLDDPYFEWLHWPQSSLPFSASELDYVASLDPFRDAAMLRAELPALTESAIRILTLCTVFLQRAASAGLCLADIGDMMTREFSPTEEGLSLSALESLCKNAHEISKKPYHHQHHDDSDEEEEESTQFGMDDVVPAALPPHVVMVGGSGIAKSVSFSAAEQGAAGRGARKKRMSFKDLSGEEWAAFMERFEKLLPAALEAKKRAGLKLTRLGTSF
uniref:1-phosphatidylinositol 4-kinase n=1 Tax=Leersia perrieri TaxID=77586 RepID=A0A0D9UZH7_9ORYZ